MPPLSPVTQDILKMTKAGVSKEVIKTYIENAAITISPGAADLVALKEQGVPDEIATTLVKRGGEARARTASPGAATAAPTQGTRRVIVRQQLDPDPESYEYFQQNYLYPRTLASAYHRLGRYSVPGYYGYYRGYGSYGPYRGYGGRRYLAPMYR